MTIKQAIKILITANKWRRGAEIEMPDVTEYGEAIDIAIAVMGAMLIKEPRLKRHHIKPKKHG
ncbi:MAG: hypothetical protein PHO36_16695 [Parabacteroides sp.]|nr:hypothetical protein [Parabacteroides sp.]